MKAIVLEEFGGPEQLKIKDIEVPQIQSSELLVEVKAAGINPIDLSSRAGEGAAQALELPFVLGWEVAGIVTQVGDNVQGFNQGDRVFGMTRFPQSGGAYAEFVSVKASDMAHIPDKLGFADAASVPLKALTAWQALVEKGNIGKNSRVLIHGASGGVGHFAVQMARKLGAHVYGTCSPENADMVSALGCNTVIDYHETDFTKVAADLDFVLGTVDEENTRRSLDCLKTNGKLIHLPGPLSDETKKLATDKQLNLEYLTVQPNGTQMKVLAEWLADGRLTVRLGLTYPFEQIQEAHRELEKETVPGSVVLEIVE
ncbi:MAG: NADP-dependent oxidoreductase [Cyclobacteriaceae bacterium]